MPSKFINWAKRYGSSARFVAENVLPYVATPPIPGIVNKLLAYIHESARDEFDVQQLEQEQGITADDLRQVEALVGVLDGELKTLVTQVARLEAMPDAVEVVRETLLEHDQSVRAGIARIETDVIAGYARIEDQNRRILVEQGFASGMLVEMMPLMRRMGVILPFLEDLRDALPVGDHLSLGEALRCYRDGQDALQTGRFSDAKSTFNALVQSCPQSSAASLALASVEAVEQDFEAMDRSLTRSVQLRPEDQNLAHLHQRVTNATRGLASLRPQPTRPEDAIHRVGDVLGEWTLTQLLGRGGMGQVFVASHGEIRAALKVMHPGLSLDPIFRKRFTEEIGALLRLGQHLNLVQVQGFDFDIDRQCWYYVMELVEGESLNAWLTRTGASESDPKAIVKAIDEVAAGLAHAHAAGIVHGDIKPDNIMVTTTATDRRPLGTPVVIDFGLARVADGPAASATGYSSGFAAPEQFHGGACDSRSDVYSLAATLYYALQFHDHEKRHVTKFKPHRVQASLRDLLARALDSDPDERPEHAAAFRKQLHGALKPKAKSQTQSQVAPAPEQAVAAEPRSEESRIVTLSFEGTQAGQRWENGEGMAFRWCPPGRFTMGSPKNDDLGFRLARVQSGGSL